MAKSHFATAIDIGTSSIKVLAGQREKNSDKIVAVVKEEMAHSVGVRRGEIYDPLKVADHLLKLKQKVYEIHGINLKRALVNISGVHLVGIKSQGLVSVSRADQKISEEDIKRVLQQASQAVTLPANTKILEVVPQEFLVNGEGGIKNPLGLEGIRLEVKALLICVFSPVFENLEETMEEAEIEIEEVVPSFLASAKAVLKPEEEEVGVAVLEIGAATTSLSVFTEGVLRDFVVFPLGGANLTNDLAVGLRIEIATAEELKKKYGSLEAAGKDKRKKKIVSSGEEAEKIFFSHKFLDKIVKTRLSEIFGEANKALRKMAKETNLPAGVVLSGGGSQLPGLLAFARRQFGLPVRLGQPQGVVGVTEPSFSVCAYLLSYGLTPLEKEKGGREVSVFKEKLKNFFRIFLP